MLKAEDVFTKISLARKALYEKYYDCAKSMLSKDIENNVDISVICPSYMNKQLGVKELTRKHTTNREIYLKVLKNLTLELEENGFTICSYPDQINITLFKDYTEKELEYIDNDNCYICMQKLKRTDILSCIGCDTHLIHNSCRTKFEKNFSYLKDGEYSKSIYAKCGICKEKLCK